MNDFENKYGFSTDEWAICLKVLEKLKDNPLENPNNEQFKTLITKIHKTAKKGLKNRENIPKKKADLKLLSESEIMKNALNNTSLYDETTEKKEATFSKLNFERNCYCCNQSFDQVHFFYHRLCPECSVENYDNRFLKTDLTGKKVILTGGRIKVGFATALRLLRNHATLTITTRFPSLAAEEFRKEKDFKQWKENLEIYGLDLRNLESVKQFIEYYHSKNDALDILINNAAQTIQYDDKYYEPLIQRELALTAGDSNFVKLIPNKTTVFQKEKAINSLAKMNYEVNRFGQPIDFRTKNSWNSTLKEISLSELLEVNLINHISPFILIKGFSELLKASSAKAKFIINVTSSEGQFSYSNKTIFHPHTNMTKSALNMLTRTSAEDYAKFGIYMNSVDVGWISTGAIEPLRKKQFERAYIPPLDSVDGSARIFHPIYEAIQNDVFFKGVLLKNYKIENW